MRPLKPLVAERFGWLENPKKSLAEVHNRSFEAVFFEYLRLLLATSLVAGLARLLLFFLGAAYWVFVGRSRIDYWIFLNYSVGISFGTALFYFFAGTFLAFFLSLALYPLFGRGAKYVEFLKKSIFSLTPLLLFGWIPLFGGALLVWTAFLFVTSMRVASRRARIAKTSVHYRD